jgi:UV DNA damage endonuclease
MVRLGLCCIFREQPIKFRTTTAASIGRMSRQEGLAKLSALCLANTEALGSALRYCVANRIGSFRVVSQILPIRTHPLCGYRVSELPDAERIVAEFEECGRYARRHHVRTCFHPDQFVVLNSPRSEVVQASLEELEYQAEVAEWIGADVINIHAGGAFGDKRQALERLFRNMDRLSERARVRLTLENDDRVYTPADLLSRCRQSGVPFVYDVHHHRCQGDSLSEEEVTDLATATWDREPLFHISSPQHGWKGTQVRRHHDYINIQDFPISWRSRRITVEVEAKAKELAVLQLMQQLQNRTE